VTGEHELAVEPLPVPDPTTLPPPERLAEFASVALFMDRAQALRPDLTINSANAAAIASICARLDGLPLAIELAAARVRALSPQELAARLDQRLGLLTSAARDAPARHRTLRDTIAWSYELLDASEQLVFRRVAVFAGGWSAAAAEEVCSKTSLALLDVLDSLVGQTLLRRSEVDGSSRFTMLQTVREFADELLRSSGEATEIHAAHAAYFQRFARETEGQLETADAAAAIRAHESERDNVRAALAWSIEQNDFEHAAEIASAIALFWWIRGYGSEGRSWIERILALPGSFEHTAARVRVLTGAGMLAFPRGDVANGRRWLEEAISLGRELGEDGLVADALHWLGDITWTDRGPTEGLSLFREASELARAKRRVFTLDATRVHLAQNARAIGDLARARELTEELISETHASGRVWATAQAHLVLAWIDQDEGDLKRADEHLRQAIALLAALGDRLSVLHGLIRFAALTAVKGDAERAVRIAASTHEQAARVGLAFPAWLIQATRGPLDAARASLTVEVVQSATAAGREMSVEGAIAYALETGMQLRSPAPGSPHSAESL
jgi:non-specific serine/threonine protein kinase